jgi:hypothetical protein
MITCRYLDCMLNRWEHCNHHYPNTNRNPDQDLNCDWHWDHELHDENSLATNVTDLKNGGRIASWPIEDISFAGCEDNDERPFHDPLAVAGLVAIVLTRLSIAGIEITMIEWTVIMFCTCIGSMMWWSRQAFWPVVSREIALLEHD